MGDLSEALFTSLDAIRSADTGSGGLAAASGTLTAKLNYFVQRDDPNYDPDRAEYWPLVIVDIIEKSDTTWGLAVAPELNTVLVRVTINALRDPGRGSQNAVSRRIKDKFDGAVPATQTGYIFGPLSLDRAYQLRGRNNAYVMVHEYSVQEGDTAAVLTGRQQSLTFTGAEGAGIGSTLFGQSISKRGTCQVQEIDYFNDEAERLTRSNTSWIIVGLFTVASSTPVVLAGAQGVLTVFRDTAAGKKTVFTNAVVVEEEEVSQTDGSAPATVRLTFRVSAVTEDVAPAVASVAAP